MNGASPDPGSFRDPDGRVYLQDGRVFRVLTSAGSERYSALVRTGLPGLWCGRGRFIDARELTPEEAPPGIAGARILEHPLIPFLTYAYEWPFAMLRGAGLLELDLFLEALERGWVLKDATPYNVQFAGTRPFHVDVTSFEPWTEGEPWKAYAQFCRLFLNPLVLAALTDLPFHPWLRGRLDGLSPEELSSLLPWHRKLRRGVFLNVAVQGWLNRRMARTSGEFSASARRIPMQKNHLRRTGESLRAALGRLKPRPSRSAWANYEEETGANPEAQAAKDRFVERALAAAAPRVVWDLGCNTGRYSLLASRSASSVVAMDSDPEVVEILYQRAVREGRSNILCLVMNLLDPSPDLGWNQAERRGLRGRGRADFTLCLALVHHLAIPGNLPLGMFLDWLRTATAGGVVEWVPKDDPRVKQLLRWREDVFPDYTQARFEEELGLRFRVLERAALPGSGRVLYAIGPRAEAAP